MQLGGSFSPGLGIYIVSITLPAGEIRDIFRQSIRCCETCRPPQFRLMSVMAWTVLSIAASIHEDMKYEPKIAILRYSAAMVKCLIYLYRARIGE